MGVATARSRPAFTSPPVARFGGVAVWLTWPAGALVQLQEPVRGTSELAAWLVGPAYDLLDARFPNRGGLLFVLDMSEMLGRSAAARSIMLRKAREVGSRFSRVLLVPPLVTPPMYLQSMRLTFALLRSVGIATEFVDSNASAIERLGLCPLDEPVPAIDRPRDEHSAAE